MINSIKKNKNIHDLSPWSFDIYPQDYQSFVPKNSEQLPKKKFIPRHEKSNPQKQSEEKKQEKNPIKVMDYALPPILTRRSFVKMKQSKDHSTLDINNYHFQKRKALEKYRSSSQNNKKAGSSETDHTAIQYDQGVKAQKIENLSMKQKIDFFHLSGHRYSLTDPNQHLQSKRIRNQNVYNDDHMEYNYGGGLPISLLNSAGQRSLILKRVSHQLKGKTIEI